MYGSGITLRGFNDNGKVLFSSNVAGIGGITRALFLMAVGETADVVFYQGQVLPDGLTGQFSQTQQAALNNSNAVAFLAAIQAGTAPNGWFLWNRQGARPRSFSTETPSSAAQPRYSAAPVRRLHSG